MERLRGIRLGEPHELRAPRGGGEDAARAAHGSPHGNGQAGAHDGREGRAVRAALSRRDSGTVRGQGTRRTRAPYPLGRLSDDPRVRVSGIVTMSSAIHPDPSRDASDPWQPMARTRLASVEVSTDSGKGHPSTERKRVGHPPTRRASGTTPQVTDDPLALVAARLFPGARLEAKARLVGGVSADVHRLDLDPGEGRTVSVVVRAPRASRPGAAVTTEFRLLRALHRRGLPVPEPLLVDTAGELLPGPFMVLSFVEGSTTVPDTRRDRYLDAVAGALARIHASSTAGLPALPPRVDPVPEALEFLPEGRDWERLRAWLRSSDGPAHAESPRLLHGDFWPENLLWRDGALVAVLDWEDAALGDPHSDVAGCALELRYRFGRAGVERFVRAYAEHGSVDRGRLALWQVYVAAAAGRFMGDWGLDPALEAHMRVEALASLREAEAKLTGHAGP